MIVLDTNILVHAHRKEASLFVPASALLKELAEGPAPWAVCYHSLVEFYGVVTRPGLWKTPSTAAQAFDQIAAWKESPSFRLLHDSDSSLDFLQTLALEGRVSGAMIHDARIAACCLSNGTKELWTVDRDFSRFPNLKTKNPLL